MTPQEFVQKWSPSELRERQGSQEHFLDLCRMLGEPTPAEADPTGRTYCFDAGAEKTVGGDGFADVWKRGCFGWEYKGKHKDLTAAYAQLQQYAASLENPPLLIVSDMDTIAIHTNFTNAIHVIHRLALSDLLQEEYRRLLKWAFTEPERLRPGMTRRQLTETAAGRFADVAQRLRERGYEPHRVAHFMNKMLFALFAEDIGLLPGRLFARLMELASRKPQLFVELAQELFTAMKAGGRLGLDEIDWFNGGLFGDDDVLPLEKAEIDLVRKVAELDWSSIEPSIFGTLFERGLDPDKRSQLGAHFTDPQSITRIVEPVVLTPLRKEWVAVKQELTHIMARHRELVSIKTEARVGWHSSREEIEAVRSRQVRPSRNGEAQKLFDSAKERLTAFLQRLEAIRILDPACGSGNFLYLALLGLKDLEHEVLLTAEELGLGRKMIPAVSPQAVMGIEVNAYAAELARVTVWIGHIQWTLRHGWGLSRTPILKPLDQISCRDAVLAEDGSEPDWPEAECIIGNPPFLGDKKMISELGEDYVSRLRELYESRVPGGADLVTFWFDKAWKQIQAGKTKRCGLVATNSIRGGQNRKVLERMTTEGRIFEAWSDEDWIADATAVRVSIVCFDSSEGETAILDGQPVKRIHADLTGETGLDVTAARPLAANGSVIFMGTTKIGPFDIPGELARKWLVSPNPHGRPNSDVLKPWVNGMDLTRRPSDTWIIDFGVDMSEEDASLYQEPFQYVLKEVRPDRIKNRREVYARYWWRHGEPRPALRTALAPLRRYICTPRVAKHRVFVWLDRNVLPDSATFAIAREDDVTFGILHSRFHEAWALRTCTWLGVGNDPRYTPTTTFGAFPFPDGLAPTVSPAAFDALPAATAIATEAKRLHELRHRWLNPPELVLHVTEAVPGFPDRVVPRNAAAAAELKKRTLTGLYNERPAWLIDAHERLDRAVAAAYRWDPNIGEVDFMRLLLEMNHASQQVALQAEEESA